VTQQTTPPGQIRLELPSQVATAGSQRIGCGKSRARNCAGALFIGLLMRCWDYRG
jgi:hypothetical protein